MQFVGSLLLVAADAKGPSFLQIADWGGDSDSDPTWPGQLLTATALSKAALELDVDGILMLGDNFYDRGVSDCNSKRFQQTFENVYPQSDYPSGMPFHVIAGNHDHYGNAQAEVDYTAIAPGGRWKFPSLWYKLNYSWTASSGASRTLDILMIDTVNLAGLSSDECVGCELPGPANLTMAASQYSWIEDELKSSTADFVWVMGHYGIYSVGDDGTTKNLVDNLLPKLKTYGAHYLSGHDHQVAHYIDDGVHMFLNGMGAECCYGQGSKSSVPDGMLQFIISGKYLKNPKAQGGFTSLEFGDDAVTLKYINEKSEVLYTYDVPKRSQSEAIV